MTETRGWEHVAEDWAEFVRSESDALYETNARAFEALLPAPGRLTVDVGCGEGRFDRRLARLGYSVVGIDASPTLVRLAREAEPEGDYRVADAAALPLNDGDADLAISFMALQDIADLVGAVAEARRVLSIDGSFCIAMVHPVASGGDFDSRDLDARFILDSYFPERTRRFPMLSSEVEQFHRPLATYVSALHDADFHVAELREVPTQRRAAGRVPMFLHLRAVPVPV